MRLVINAEAKDEEYDKLMGMTKLVINEQKSIFGTFPSFFDSTYTFLCSYGPGYFSDGMEHRNSTIITDQLSLSGNEDQLISGIAHEFFHIWNIERIRPASLEPFDFTKANLSGEPWFR